MRDHDIDRPARARAADAEEKPRLWALMTEIWLSGCDRSQLMVKMQPTVMEPR